MASVEVGGNADEGGLAPSAEGSCSSDQQRGPQVLLVNVELVEAAPGDIVLVHAGVAIARSGG